MRVVALEEHFTVPALVSRIDPDAISRRGFRPRRLPPGRPNPLELPPEIGERRLESMDEAGITVQVLSNTGPGPDLVPGPDGVAMAREMNDHLAAAIARHPDRFAGFAVLPMQSPDGCAAELTRAVKELASSARSSTAPPRAASSITRATTACWRRPWSSTCRSTSTRTWRPRPCGRPTTPTCSRARAACSKAPAGAGIRRRRSTCCAWCWPARSTAIRGSSSSSATWARCCR